MDAVRAPIAVITGIDAWRPHMAFAPALSEPLSIASADVDLVELYFDRGWTDGLPVVAPTHDKVDAVVRALGGNPGFVECKVAILKAFWTRYARP